MRLVRVLYAENCIFICNIPKKTLYENSSVTCNARNSFHKTHFMCLYSQSEWRTAVSTCGHIANPRQRKGLCQPIRIVYRLHSNSNSVSDLASQLSAPPSNFPAKAEKSSRLVPLGCCSDVFVWHQENKNTSSKSQEDVSLPKKNLVSRNELREIENIGARDVNVFIANFLLQVREFLFLICVKKTISMKILV